MVHTGDPTPTVGEYPLSATSSCVPGTKSVLPAVVVKTAAHRPRLTLQHRNGSQGSLLHTRPGRKSQGH